MELIVRDSKTGKEHKAVIGIEEYDLLDDNDFLAPFAIIDEIDRAVAHLFLERLFMANKMYKVGDRVAAYDHKGQRHGKGVVIPSRDKRLADYIHVRLDSGFEAYYRADLCKRLVPKVKPDVEA